MSLYKLPYELKSKIFLFTDFQTCLKHNMIYEAKKLFNPKIHTWTWASNFGNLKIVKFLHDNRIEGFCSYTIYYSSLFKNFIKIKMNFNKINLIL
jgi:hypothetical protein